MINLHYIRAAIEANTGQRLTLERVRTLLVEEGLITQRQADADARIFTYHDFYDFPDTEPCWENVDTELGLPDIPIPGA